MGQNKKQEKPTGKVGKALLVMYNLINKKKFMHGVKHNEKKENISQLVIEERINHNKNYWITKVFVKSIYSYDIRNTKYFS